MARVPDLVAGEDGRDRCGWCGSDALYRAYHDREWGVPVDDDRALFEFLTLEGAQAGLSWITVLRKREAYRRAFAGFDPARVARFDARKVAALLKDPGIVRNRLKVASAVANARAFLEVRKEFGSFARYAWGWVGGRSRVPRPRALAGIPPSDAVSAAWSRDLKRRGFRFVGPTIVYAHMQATGMVNDHLEGCWRAHRIPEYRWKGEPWTPEALGGGVPLGDQTGRARFPGAAAAPVSPGQYRHSNWRSNSFRRGSGTL